MSLAACQVPGPRLPDGIARRRGPTAAATGDMMKALQQSAPGIMATAAPLRRLHGARPERADSGSCRLLRARKVVDATKTWTHNLMATVVLCHC